jgi:hypothetical protein
MITKKTKTNMTLYQSLKPEIKQKLKEQAVFYPSIVGSIVEELQSNDFWSRLSVSTVHDIISFTDTPYGSLTSFDWAFGKKFLCED